MSKYEMPHLPDGSKNPKYVDLLEEDKQISGQKFACVSFLSPENILKSKDIFFFEKFLKVWDFTKSAEKYQQFLNFISHKYNLSFDALNADLDDFCKEEKSFLKNSNIENDYKTFLDNNEQNLQKDFDNEHQFQTSVRAVKIRGNYETQQEAEIHCKLLREKDPNHDIFVGPVGVWMPWEPEAYKTGNVNYLEPELNELMKEKNENDKKSKNEFQRRVDESKRKAIEENISNAKKSGNKLTQNIDASGNLFKLNENTSSDLHVAANIKQELFESQQDNVVLKKTDNIDENNEK